MPRHIFRLIILIVVFAGIGYAAKRFFTTTSFYEYGHYRGNSVAEIASEKPRYKGLVDCASCHLPQATEWATGVHYRPELGKIVKCEVCHGPGGARDSRGLFEISRTGADHPDGLKLAVPQDTRKLCTLCHERLVARPPEQRQIVVAEHAGTQQCVTCHNPHSPRLDVGPAFEAGQPSGDPAAGKTKAAACAGCHGDEGVSNDLPGPSLAGQNPTYLVTAIKSYAAGVRSDSMMSAIAQGVSDEDARDLAAYFAGLACASPPAAARQESPAGQAAASRCAACHGPSGRGPYRSWPNLAGLSKGYLAKALQDYRSGARNNGLMAGVVKDLNETDADGVTTYFAGAACR